MKRSANGKNLSKDAHLETSTLQDSKQTTKYRSPTCNVGNKSPNTQLRHKDSSINTNQQGLFSYAESKDNTRATGSTSLTLDNSAKYKNLTCPLCKKQYPTSKSLKLHHNHCSLKQFSTNTETINSNLQDSILAGEDQEISIVDSTQLRYDITSEERSHKKKRFGFHELNAQFKSLQPLSTNTSHEVRTACTNQMQEGSHSGNNDTEHTHTVMDENRFIDIDVESESVSSDDDTFDKEMEEKQAELLHLNKLYLENLPKGFASDYLIGFNLTEILNKANSPLYLYDEIMTWASKSFNQYQYRFPESGPSSSRCKLKDFAFKSTSSNSLHPKSQFINIGPQRDVPVEVVKFDTIGMIHSLLSDPDLMKDENLLFTGDDPYPKFNENGDLPNPSVLKDINSGIWFKKASETLCEDVIDIVCPILLFIDGLTIDEYSNIQLEPVTFTLGIFKREIRNQDKAWRTLGYINNVNEHDAYNKVQENEEDLSDTDSDDTTDGNAQKFTSNYNINSCDKLTDYHTILDEILSELREIQDFGGLLWDIPFRGRTHRVRLKFPIQFVIGDCKGHNLLCGRYGSNNTNSLCRDCDVLLINGGDPSTICKRITQEQIETLIERNDNDSLKRLSFHNLKNNCFNKLCFSGDPYGIYGATLPELLHVLRITLTGHVISEFKARSTGDELDLLHLLSTTIGNYGSRQSDRSMYKIKFSRYITNIARLSGDDKMGAIFLIFLSLFTTRGLQTYSKNGSTLKLILPAAERLLIFHEWAMSDTHRVEDLFEDPIINIDNVDQMGFNLDSKSPAYKAIKRLMVTYKNGVQRTEGNGFNFPKFHQLLHTVMNILRHGSMRNWDGARLEAIGKTTGKQPCRRTQRNTRTLLKQTGERYAENIVFKRCHSMIKDHYGITEKRLNGSQSLHNRTTNSCLKGSSYKVFIKENNDPTKLTLEWSSDKIVVLNNGITANAAFYAYNYLRVGRADSSIVGNTLNFRTEFIDSKGNIFRSHPSYRSEGPWHDWLMIRWENTRNNRRNVDIVPAKVFGFFELKDNDIVPNSTTCAGIWMVVSSLCYDPVSLYETLSNQNAFDNQYLESFQLAKKWKIDYDNEGYHKFWIVNTDNIHDTAYVVPDINLNYQLSKEYVIVVNKRKKWKNYFVKTIDRRAIDEDSEEESI